MRAGRSTMNLTGLTWASYRNGKAVRRYHPCVCFARRHGDVTSIPKSIALAELLLGITAMFISTDAEQKREQRLREQELAAVRSMDLSTVYSSALTDSRT
jgi:hypothetical protein